MRGAGGGVMTDGRGAGFEGGAGTRVTGATFAATTAEDVAADDEAGSSSSPRGDATPLGASVAGMAKAA